MSKRIWEMRMIPKVAETQPTLFAHYVIICVLMLIVLRYACALRKHTGAFQMFTMFTISILFLDVPPYLSICNNQYVLPGFFWKLKKRVFMNWSNDYVHNV